MDKEKELKSLEKLAELIGTIAEELDEKTEETTTTSQEILEDLSEVLSMLLPRERQVLTLRFGFKDGNKKTLDEVGKLLDISKERVRQIEAKALRKLRNPQRLMNLTKTDIGVK